MGFLDAAKGRLNIGGVEVQLQDVLTSKGDEQVFKLIDKFLLQKTTGRGENRQTKAFGIGQSTAAEPFEIKAGESKTLDFAISDSIDRSLADMSGVLGAVGKLVAFAAGEMLEDFVGATCDVKGTALDPGAKVEVTLVD